MPEVDRSFLRDLKSMDRRLGTKFNGQNFIVTYRRPFGEPVNIYCIKADNGGFRQPDKRDLMVIKGGDLAEGVSMDIRLKQRAYASELMTREAKRKAKENIRDMTKDDKRQLAKAFIQRTNLSKGNSTFRRIDHKSGKNVVRVAV